jgi:hypothetical protein
VLKERRLSGDPYSSAFASALSTGYRSGGWRGALIGALKTRLVQRRRSYVSPYEMAALYANLGDKESAFKWLEAASQERNMALRRLNTDFLLDPLRSDARLAELAGKVGLPQ